VGDNILELISEGVEAEKLGFDFVWIPDHLVDISPLLAIFDSWTSMGYLGAKTQSVKIGSGVTDIQRIHPAKIANIIATLDNLTQGRAVLGIGAGEIMNTRPFGIPWEDKKIRLRKLRETIEVIKLLWSSGYKNPVSFEGEFFSLVDAHLSCAPLQKPHPPIYVGSFSSEATLRMVGEVADGWYPGSQYSPELFGDKVKIIKEAARRSKRDPESIDVMVSVPTFVTGQDETKNAKVKKKIMFAMKRKLILNQFLLKFYGLDHVEAVKNVPRELEYQFATPGPDYDQKLNKAADSLDIPQDIMENLISKIVAIGSGDECVSFIEKYIQAGATHIFFSSFAASRENYRLIGEKVIPAMSGN
jgi:phthiodiolone/phenolphthiodiolone dimycocerosates ketoreductase